MFTIQILFDLFRSLDPNTSSNISMQIGLYWHGFTGHDLTECNSLDTKQMQLYNGWSLT